MRSISRRCLGPVAAALALSVASIAAEAATKKLIHMGWDEPDPAFMRRHIAQLEASPFDGCVYHLAFASPNTDQNNFTWESWGARRFTEQELAADLANLQATPFRRFRSNFLRMNVTPGRIDWFDDYRAVLANARLGASVARRGGSAGIFLDTEQYQGHLFEYPSQRDRATKSFYEYSQQARRRGAEVMRAFEQGYPGLTVFVTLTASWPYIVAHGKSEALERAPYGLLVAFVDGMIAAASDSARIVDGMEASYPARDTARVASYQDIQTHRVLAWHSDTTKYRRVVSRSMAFWLDFDWRSRGWDGARPSRNYHSPNRLEAVVRKALQGADEYVWIYNETPRWWTEAGGRKALPVAYDRALRRAKAAANAAAR
jgi:hypothetical protein